MAGCLVYSSSICCFKAGMWQLYSGLLICIKGMTRDWWGIVAFKISLEVVTNMGEHVCEREESSLLGHTLGELSLALRSHRGDVMCCL